jgi:hypothetical protein
MDFRSVRANSVRRLSCAEAEVPTAAPSTEAGTESGDAPYGSRRLKDPRFKPQVLFVVRHSCQLVEISHQRTPIAEDTRPPRECLPADSQRRFRPRDRPSVL